MATMAWLTVKAAAEYLGCSASFLNKLRMRSDGPSDGGARARLLNWGYSEKHTWALLRQWATGEPAVLNAPDHGR
jgi:hypothetical protein